ncbi:MAG: hypothetical protein JRJ87_27730 [Deltaproteobacteria bacterium]|nr:hypothetical protein [Deltaproteobacteria bacterium]
MNRTRVALFLAGLMLLCMPVTTGCMSALSYQTADTVPKGGVEFGMAWSVTKLERIKYTDSQGNVTQVDDELMGTLPNPLPDLYMRFGLADNLDIGFRLFFLGIHSDIKIRLVNTDIFSLSLAPGLGYSRPFIVFGEYSLDLPLLMTFKLGEHVKIYLTAHGRISGWHLELYGTEEVDDIHTFGAGANLGFEFGTKTWFIRPEVGYMNYFVGFEDKCSEKMEFSWFTFGLGFGFVFGVEDERQDNKIQKLEERLEQLEKDQGSSGPTTAPPPVKAKSTDNPDDVRKRADEAAKDLAKEEEKREGA